MPTIITRGAGSAQGLGYASSSAPVTYVEDVFSTYLYTGNGSTQTITNGIDLSGKGGLVWMKNRSADATFGQNYLSDTARGITKYLVSNNTDQQFDPGNVISSVTATGFNLGNSSRANNSGVTYASWTFRKQPKFFDIVTWSGDGSAQNIAHNLGSAPGCIIVKDTNGTGNWAVYHRSLGNAQWIKLNLTDAAAAASASFWNLTNPTSSVFSVGTAFSNIGYTYVAYLFAHDAGGFGLTGTDNVISCGSVSTDASGATPAIELGWEPQFTIFKSFSGVSASENWRLHDNMRGLTVTPGNGKLLNPNTSGAEVSTSFGTLPPSATGFAAQPGGSYLDNSTNYIYIAIRRGPMKVPTSGTSVFKPNAYTGTGAVLPITGMGFPPDFLLTKSRFSGNDWPAQDKLRGPSQYLRPNGTIAELNLGTNQLVSIDQDGVTYGAGSSATNFSGSTYINLSFRRAPVFFDEVCYTGTGVARTVTHNLAAVPQLMIVKSRSDADGWWIWNNSFSSGYIINFDSNAVSGVYPDIFGNDTVAVIPTATVFSVGSNANVNRSGGTFVTYLFATCPGVSKVGSYTGTGTTQVINCGFTAGSRFVLIKRTDSTGDWYVWDSARGIVAGNDPYLLLNSTAAEVTSTDYVDTAASGFEISSTAPAAINANGGSFIFLAIA